LLVTEQQNLKPVSNICVGSGGKPPTPPKPKSINILLVLLLLFLLSFAPVLLLCLLPETKKKQLPLPGFEPMTSAVCFL
jgi:hypothetical protein